MKLTGSVRLGRVEFGAVLVFEIRFALVATLESETKWCDEVKRVRESNNVSTSEYCGYPDCLYSTKTYGVYARKKESAEANSFSIEKNA